MRWMMAVKGPMMSWQKAASLIVSLGTVIALTACDSGDILPGTRLAVFSADQGLLTQGQVDPVQLTAPTQNSAWAMNGGSATNANYHLAIAGSPQQQWSSDIGAPENARQKMTAQPIIANGLVYAMDAVMNVSAHTLSGGGLVWRVNVADPTEASSTFGGGLAYADGRIFVTTGDAEMYALSSQTGRALWRSTLAGPARSGPTYANGNLYVQTLNNQSQAFAAANGRALWTHVGLPEVTSLVGGGSPTVQGDYVYVAYSSGEVYALNARTGQEIWSDIIPSRSPSSGRLQLEVADIQALPVLDRGVLFVVSNGGRSIAYDSINGRVLWQADAGGTQTPALGQGHIFMVTNGGTALALDRNTGRATWIKDLGTNANRSGAKKIEWYGPMLAGNRLLFASNQGKLVALSPFDGRLLGELSLSGGVVAAPVVAQGTMVFLTQRADLSAYR